MSYRIDFETSNKHVDVDEGDNLLDAALNADMMLPYSCRGGSCGSCSARLLSGEISYPEGQPRSLSESAQQEGQILLCQAQACSDLKIKERPMASEAAIPLQMLPTRVAALNKLNHDVMQLKLQPPGTRKLNFYAGQYIDIMLADGRRRSFSIANAPHEDEFIELHIRRVPDGYFTNFVFTELEEKALLRLQGPLGSFFLREDSTRPIIMIAGGTGYAPFAGMLKHAFKQGITRPIHLFWGVRTPDDMYANDAKQWANEHDNFSFTPVFSESSSIEGSVTGWVHDAVLQSFPNLSQYEVYMVGPPPMINACQDALVGAGADADHIYYDSFDFSHG